ncbi:Uncharacterised protein [uncultured archaeon]|nr:Uncharacterised protein [uncultured archaeon]
MGYTSFVMEDVGTSKYSRLEMQLRLNGNNGTFLVNVPRTRLPKGFNLIDMDGSIDIIFNGDLKKLEDMLKRAGIRSAGVVKYDGQPVTLAHSQALTARDIAEESKQPYVIYEK